MKRLMIAAVVVTLMLCAVPGLPAATQTAAAAGGTRVVDATTGATPNCRTFLRDDLKSMPYTGGNYTCLKAQAPFTYFTQEWYGLRMSYLLDVEVGLKPDTTGIKVYSSDGYSYSFTSLNEMRDVNSQGLYTLLAWKKGAENKTGGPYSELDNTEGPFRLIVPQATVGPHGVGTPNWNKAAKMVRAIEVQPTPPGLPSVDPASVPPGEVLVYGNVLGRRTFTVNQLESIAQTSGTYHWKNSYGTQGNTTFKGLTLPYLINTMVGQPSAATSVTAYAGDGYDPQTFTMNQVNGTYPGGLQMLLATQENGQSLPPGPPYNSSTSGPIRLIRPQTSTSDVNTSSWVKYLRVLNIDSAAGDPVPNASRVPPDRVIVSGDTLAGNVPSTWYMAEGYTGAGFEEFICIANPNSWKTNVEIEYMIEGANPQTQQVSIAPRSRTTVNVNGVVGPDKNVSAKVTGHEGDSVVAERALYWNGRSGGACATGVNSPAKTWYLAEGSTASGFETWVLVQNPNDQAARVNVTYMDATGEKAGPVLNMPPHSRTTVNVGKDLPEDAQVSTRVAADRAVIAERSMYWNGRKAGSCASGVTNPGTAWYMAEGSTAEGFETWILVQNPGNDAANVNVTYMNADGQHAGPALTVPPHSRVTVNAAATLPNDSQVSTKVTSNKAVIAERAVYWNARNGGHCENAVDSPKFHSFLAEGSTADGFESWILVQNPGPVDATVYITYLTGSGAMERAPLSVPAGKRVTVNESADVGANSQVSAQLSSTAGVAVERAVYWNGRTEGSCAKGYLGW